MPKIGKVEVDHGAVEESRRETIFISFETGHTGVTQASGIGGWYR